MTAQGNGSPRHQLPVRHQCNRHTCVAFASAAAHESIVDATKHHSSEFVFWLAKNRDGLPPGEKGTTIPAALGGIMVRGGLPETAWPYGAPAFPPGPPPTVASSGPFIAAGFSYKKLPDDFDAIAQALARGPVVLGLAVQSGPVWIAPSGVLMPSNSASIRGAHAVLALGHDVNKDALIFKNSWGPKWGNAGYGFATRAYVDAHALAAYEVS